MQQNPSEPNPAPIPYPEALPESNLPTGGNWSTAPIVIRGWSYQLALLSMFATILFCVVNGFGNDPLGEKIFVSVVMVFVFAFFFWLRKAIRQGAKGAWVSQIVLSGLGLLAFPLGTLVHGYILSQWFKPEVKAWFGQR